MGFSFTERFTERQKKAAELSSPTAFFLPFILLFVPFRPFFHAAVPPGADGSEE